MVTRDPQVYEAPDEFRPDRWDKDASQKIHPFSSLPFSFGPRSCYGKFLTHTQVASYYVIYIYPDMVEGPQHQKRGIISTSS